MSIFLGFDSSTQGLKAILIDTSPGSIIESANVNYSEELPDYQCPNGVLDNPDPLVKHSDPMMWIAALDLVLKKLQQQQAPLDQVCGISGSGQQHGSVYLNKNFPKILAGLNRSMSLAEQLSSSLSRKSAPIWMDSSTSPECAELTEIFGSRLQSDTGSPAVERFTGPQIRKFWKKSPEKYSNTVIIHLVSSFMASVLCGKNAPIDYGDGAGMNLLNLNTLQWDPEIADATAPDLLSRLPQVVPSKAICGKLHYYFEKYGLKAGIPVVVWSGDNPNSLIGTGAGESGTAVISLGTSDTFFASMDSNKTDPDGYGHVFGNPAGGFMTLSCFKNGSLAREKIKEECQVGWDYFGTTAFSKSTPGNNGNIILPYFVPEITPLILKEGVHLQGDNDFCAGNAPIEIKIRAVVEAQALSMKLHSEWIGNFNTLRLTGGASQSPGLCQVFADVFQAEVEKIAIADSAALGAAMRAANACQDQPWDQLYSQFSAANKTISPNQKTKVIYMEMLENYRQFEMSIVKHTTG